MPCASVVDAAVPRGCVERVEALFAAVLVEHADHALRLLHAPTPRRAQVHGLVTFDEFCKLRIVFELLERRADGSANHWELTCKT